MPGIYLTKENTEKFYQNFDLEACRIMHEMVKKGLTTEAVDVAIVLQVGEENENGNRIGTYLTPFVKMKLTTGSASEMDDKAQMYVHHWIEEHMDKSDPPAEFETFIVWKCKTLQNWKYLISTTLPDGMYYEMTYDGDKHTWYLDAYKKFHNRAIHEITEEEKAEIIRKAEEKGPLEDNQHPGYTNKEE